MLDRNHGKSSLRHFNTIYSPRQQRILTYLITKRKFHLSKVFNKEHSHLFRLYGTSECTFLTLCRRWCRSIYRLDAWKFLRYSSKLFRPFGIVCSLTSSSSWHLFWILWIIFSWVSVTVIYSALLLCMANNKLFNISSSCPLQFLLSFIGLINSEWIYGVWNLSPLKNWFASKFR